MSLKQINPQDAWKILDEDKHSLLVDVRTFEELNFVGHVDLSSIAAKSIILPWRIYPRMELNSAFISELSNFIAKTFPSNPLDTNLLFLCKTGGRSNEAAKSMSEIGYKNTYNITGGFEGEADSSGHRGNINGWKAANLPWEQQ
jgi:rhodanese-related sulfurtransferase